MSDHPRHEDLAALVFGDLSDDQAEQVAQHVEDCAQCEETVQQLETDPDDVIRLLRRPAVEHPFEQESGCRRLVEVAGAIGREPSFGRGRANVGVDTVPEDLGMLCEYRLLSKLGQGGMGTVYRALHTKLDKAVAVKVLPSDKLQDARAVSRFEREMKAVGKLDHPNIVRALDAREVDGQHFLVMEYVSGLDLSKLVHRRGPLPIPDACEIIRQAAHGLEYAHEHGLVHRDIKPSNLMLSVVERQESRVQSSNAEDSVRLSTLDPRLSTPSVKILDLGLARLQSWQAEEAEELTGSGQMMGTLDYMAPEQGTDCHTVDIRADIYSLGATLYKLLCGAAPFAGEKYDTPVKKMMALATEPVAPIRERRPDVPDELAAVLDRMLARNPDERYATPAEVIAALEPFTAGCDLSGLMAKAEETVETGDATDKSLSATDEHASSALVGTTSSEPSPAQPMPLVSRRRWRPLAIAIGLMLAAIGAVGAWQITIIIRDPEGRERTFQTAEKDTVIIKQDDREIASFPKDEPKRGEPAKEAGKVEPKPDSQAQPQPLKIGPPVPRPKPVSIQLEPEPIDLQPGAPTSQLALVPNPAALPGVRSWTIETIGHRGTYDEYLAYSPDGQKMATCCRDDTIRLWDAKDGRFLRALVGHDGSIHHVCWSPDGKILASASDDGTIRLWDAKTGLRLSTFRNDGGFKSVAWSPDGRFLAGVTTDIPITQGTIHLWEFCSDTYSGNVRDHTVSEGWRLMAPGIRTHVLPVPMYGRSANLAWSPDGTKLAFLSCHVSTWSTVLYDVVSNRLASSDIIHKRWVQATQAKKGLFFPEGITWSPDGQVIACGERPILLLDVGLREVDSQIPEKDGPITNYFMAWSPKGRYLASCYRDGATSRTWVWDCEQERQLFEPIQTARPAGVPVAYAPDGETLAVGWQICDAESGVPRRVLPVHNGHARVRSVWSEDGRLFARKNGYSPIQIWEPYSSRLLYEVEADKGYGIHSMAWSSAGTLAIADRFNVTIWHSADPQRPPRSLFPRTVPGVHMCWAPNARTLIANHRTGSLAIYDVASRKELHRLDRPEGKTRECLDYSPDGTTVAFGEGNELRIWDTATFQVEPLLTTLPAPVCGLSWSPDGTVLAAACEDRKVHLIDVESKQIIAACEGHETPAVSFGWTEDGKTLVTACQSYQGETGVCVWDAKSGKRLRTIPDGGEVSPDGRLVAWQGQSMIRLRETETGQVVSTLLSLRDSQYAAISPDGHFSGSPGVEKELVYVVQTDEGQFTLTPAEFAEKYGWKNDPEKVRLNLAAPAESEETK